MTKVREQLSGAQRYIYYTVLILCMSKYEKIKIMAPWAPTLRWQHFVATRWVLQRKMKPIALTFCRKYRITTFLLMPSIRLALA